MKKKIIIGATVAAIAIPTVAGLALASGWSHGMGRHHVAMDKMIKEIDLDANGSIARDELAKWQVQQVTNFDGNDDGKIDLKEFEAMWLSFLRERMVDSFQELDADGDAAVTVIEFQNPTNHIFDRLDRDNNGIVSQDEIAKLKHHRKGKGLMHKMHDDDDDDKDDDHS